MTTVWPNRKGFIIIYKCFFIIIIIKRDSGIHQILFTVENTRFKINVLFIFSQTNYVQSI